MNRIKHFLILALALTLSLGAWAQGQLLTTINASSGFTNGTQTFDNIVTVTLDDASYDANDGWFASGSPRPVEVAPVNGVTVTGYMLYFSATGPMEFEGSSFEVALEGYRVLADDISTQLGSVGITKIEVYGYAAAPDPTVPALDETTGHWNFLMPGSNKVVNVNYYDSVLIGANVSVSCDNNYLNNIAYGYRNADGDTILYFENSPILTLTANAPEGKAFDGWNDGNTDNPRMVTLEGDTAFLPIFYTPHTLTLNQADGGTLSLDGVTEPGATGTTFTVPEDWKNNNNPLTVYNFPGFEAVSLEEARNWQPPVSGNYRLYYNIEENILYYVSYSSDGSQATGSSANIRKNIYNVQDDGTTVAYTTGAIPGGLPAGVLARNANGSYQVKSGTELTLVATPDTAHYLTKIGNYDTLDNHTVEYTFTMPDEDTTVAPTFEAKPTLTLAANDGGTLEAFDAANVTRIGTTNQYYIDYGTPVTVVATPDTVHYLATLGNEVVNSNDSIHRTYTMTTNLPLNAVFAAKPRLTLAQNEEWGLVSLDLVQYPYLGTSENTGPLFLTDEPDVYAVDYGTTLTVQATATELHHVANWVNADSEEYPAAAITYSDYFVTTPEPLFPAYSTLTLTLTADATAKAVFGINSYDVTASVAPTTDERGTVRIASTDVQGAAQVSDSLATVTATAQGGSTSTLTAYPAWGYHFVEWQNQNGTQVSTDNPLAVTSAVDTALVAVFDTTKAELAWSDESFTGYTLIDFNNWAPTLTNSHNVEVRYGCVEGTLNVDAQSGIVGIEVAYGHIANTPNTFHIYAVHDLSQEYFYDSVVYTLTVERGTIVSLSQNIETGGTAVFADQNSLPTLTHHYASGIMAFVAHGHTVDLVAEPAEGYHFTAWQEGDLISGYTDIATSLEYTYTVPDATTIGLKAVFDTNVYNVTIVNDHDTLTDLAMGVDTVYRMKHFLDQPLTAEAKFGYYFVQWADSVTDNPRMVNVTGDTAFRAQYDRRTFYVTVVVDTARAHGSGTRICRYLDYFPITITPKHGYHFVQWSDGNTQNPRYVTCTGNATYSAQMAPDQFTVSGSANQNLGTISGLGNHDYMSTATLTATPNHGYLFDHWNDGVTANPRSVVVTKDTAFEAFFVIGQYTVTAASANATMGSAAGTATVNYLDTVQISATANAHYHFVKWNDNNTQNPRKVVATNNVTYTAQFAADNYTVTGLADQGMGSVTGSGSYAYLSNATLTAVPACGYLFDHWSNDSTATTITVKVTGPTTLTAYFRPAVVDTVTVTVHDTTVVTNTVIVHDTTYVDIHDSVDVTVYVHDTTTVEVPVYVHDTTMVEVLVHDTTTVEVPVYVHDTTMVEVPVYVHDTTYIDIHDSVDVTVYVYVHDTTTVEVPVYMHDTTTVEVPVYVYDTTTVTVEVPVYVYDTTTVEVPVYVHDTTTIEVPVYVYDTTTIEVPVHDTTTVTEYIVDTLWLTEYIHDTVWQIKYIYDTIYIHDTIFVGIDDVEALDAKIYAMGGQIVVEGADGNKVVLYDVTGRILAKKQDEFAPLRFDIPASGTYLVKIGNHAARRIVMIR